MTTVYKIPLSHFKEWLESLDAKSSVGYFYKGDVCPLKNYVKTFMNPFVLSIGYNTIRFSNTEGEYDQKLLLLPDWAQRFVQILDFTHYKLTFDPSASTYLDIPYSLRSSDGEYPQALVEACLTALAVAERGR